MNSNKRPVVILGHKGMLGQMACRYFSKKGYPVHTIETRFEEDTRCSFFDKINEYRDAVVINCIGSIKQKTNDTTNLLWTNAIFPLAMHNYLSPGHLIIHPSTDCVFNGITGAPYKSGDIPNGEDVYGWSKRLGDVALAGRKNTIILRVSIVGPDQSAHPKGLLGWFLSNPPNAELKGFTNHFWNGITTLEWCRQAENLFLHDEYLNRECKLVQLGTKEHYSKYEMLMLFQKIYNANFRISAFGEAAPVDRRLIPDVVCKRLPEQLAELKAYM